MIRRFVLFVWNRWFGEPLRKIEASALAYRASPAGQNVDWKTVVVVLTTAGCLTLQNYTGLPEYLGPFAGGIAELFTGVDGRREVNDTLRAWSMTQGTRLCWGGINAFITYAIIPALVIKLVFRERLTDYGIGIRGIIADWPVYVAFAMIMMPLVWAFSSVERFQNTYPFYRIYYPEDVNGDYFRWELVYALQFIGLEFFFRGFMVHGTKHRFGAYSVFLMVVPYCMIHFHKPIPETIGSIIAGVALGLVSLVTRSIWPGAALHILVAWGMDTSCLVRRGMLL
jgi:membrane protease YdiL (CAAX protease family)